MTRPRRLNEVRFYGGDVCLLADLDFEATLPAEAARLGSGLDRSLAEIFYCDAAFCLDLGWYDASGRADGHYPDGEFILRLSAGQLMLWEWRTRDLGQLRRYVLQARDRAAQLHPRRDRPTTLLQLLGDLADAAALAAEVDALLAAQLPGHRVTRRCVQWPGGDHLLWTALPPLQLAEAAAVYAALQDWGQRRGAGQLDLSELLGWLDDLRGA
ncbi:hypothetical protein [Deinococcus sp. Marseille-Q6407]|uniref:hypothetical protein n=1 Tax=Deinococcus sp. Marseille-Q6407 TaxID=2969223 RepID=UPI0021BE00BD|nr:hypothetical protein [Deinococcus sp. Marseille-Q6407]